MKFAISSDSERRRKRMLYYKLSLFAILAIVTFFQAMTFLRGIGLRTAINRSAATKVHRFYALWLFWSVLVLVFAIEGKVRIFGSGPHDKLFFAHLIVAVLLFLVLLATVFFFNGEKFAYHAWFGYIELLLFLGTVSLGIPMILRMKA